MSEEREMELKLILASSSPRRARLLSEAGIKFTISPSGEKEIFDSSLAPSENARRIAVAKADSVAAGHTGSPVLAADTIVVLDGEVIGKPVDEEDARLMLKRLSGREHEVITGIALVHIERKVRWSSSQVSKVRFAQIPDEEISKYVSGGEPMDKAGAYAIQGGAGGWIVGHKGSFSNIVGLPMEKLIEALDRLGYKFHKDSAPCRW